MYLHNGKSINVYETQVIGDVQYPAAYLADESNHAALGIVKVTNPTPPAVTRNQKAVAIAYVDNGDGTWSADWAIKVKSDDEVASDEARRKLAAERKWSEIKAERDRRKSAGVEVGGHWFHSDADSRIQWLGMLLQGQNLPPYKWSTIDNGTVSVTPTLAQQVALEVGKMDDNLFYLARTKKAAMEAMDDPDLFDHLADWPPTFGE